jgi:transposase
MQTITTIGLDIAKPVFQVHGIDAEGNVILRRQLKRRHAGAGGHAEGFAGGFCRRRRGGCGAHR